MRRLALLAVLAGLAGPAAAQTDRPVLRPEARPVPAAPLRPVARPPAEGDAQEDPGPPAVDRLALAVTVAPQAPPARPLARASVRASEDPAGAAPLTEAPRLHRAEAMMNPPALRLVAEWSAERPPARPLAETRPARPALAAAPLRPALRPERQLAAVALLPQAPDAAPGPQIEATEAEPRAPGYSEFAVALALRPPARSERVVQAAARVREERARGAICGSADIQGEVLGTVDGPGACGVDGAVRVRSVAGVRLSTPATMDCRTAQSLLRWMQTGAIPAVGDQGGGLASIRVVSHYACRGRNNQAGARLSEHAFGRAIDIAGFGLRNGGEFTVLNGWGSSAHGARLRRMHEAACGPFGTVLGPEANRFHRDHFHFDTARHRSGSYCR